MSTINVQAYKDELHCFLPTLQSLLDFPFSHVYCDSDKFTTDPEKLGVSSTLYGKQLRNIQSLLFSNDPFYYIGDLILCVNILLFDFHVVSLLMASVFHYKSRYSLLQVKFQNSVRSPCS